jgi:hypothetical protein
MADESVTFGSFAIRSLRVRHSGRTITGLWTTRPRAISRTSVSAPRARDLVELPIIECTRTSMWGYIGFKHIHGPKHGTRTARRSTCHGYETR